MALSPVSAFGVVVICMVASLGVIVLLERLVKRQRRLVTGPYGIRVEHIADPEEVESASSQTSADIYTGEGSKVDSKSHRWLVYMLYGILVQILGTAAGAMIGQPTLGEAELLTIVAGALILGGSLVSSVGYLAGFYVYIVDAAVVQEETDGWPNRGLYILGHIFLPPIVALLYLSKRNQLVGNDYHGTLAGHLPLVG